MKAFVIRCFSLDLRSLAVMRICLALVLIWDLIVRLTVLDDFHTDSGFFPRSDLARWPHAISCFSVHLFTGESWATACLFLFHLACLVCMGLGYRTQLSTFLCWVLGNSLQTRNPFILDSGDRLYLLILLWAFFCRWGTYYSLDSRRTEKPASPKIFNVGTVGLVLQLCVVYWFSVYFKWDPIWLSEGTALYIAMNLELFCRPLAKSLLPYWDFMRFGTGFTMFAEILGPALILFGRRWFKLFGIACLFLLHLAILLLMSIGIFPLVSLAFLIGFMPSMVWERLQGLDESEARSSQPSWSETREARFLDITAATLLVLSVWWNCHRAFKLYIPSPVFKICMATKLDQYWNLFAPTPRTLDCWFVIEGTTKSGVQVDLWMTAPKPLSWDKPESVSSTFYSHRDRMWATACESVLSERTKNHFLEVKAERYNTEHREDPLVHVRFYRMEQITALGYRWVKPEPVVLFEVELIPADDNVNDL
jgi:hypothetical protein